MNQALLIVMIVSLSGCSTETSQNENTTNTNPMDNLRYRMNIKRSNLENSNLSSSTSCKINIFSDHVRIDKRNHEKWPLVLEADGKPRFINANYNGDIILRTSEKIRLVCTGTNNRFTNVMAKNKIPDIVVTCHSGKHFEFQGKILSFDMFGCAMFPDSEDLVLDDGHHQVGFRMHDNQFIPLLDIHYDNNFEVIHVTHKLPYVNRRQKVSRIPFRDGNHPLGKNVNRYYNKYEVEERMTRLLGKKNSKKYFNDISFITRGHLAPKGDFVFAAQQLATFFLMNINPQFSGLNNINWNFLETSIREHDFGDEVTVHTGSSRILELPGQSPGKNESIFLADNNKLPIPQIYWKIVEVSEEEKYSFIGFNYPTTNSSEFSDVASGVCKDLCGTKEYSWLVDDIATEEVRRDPLKGYLLCCSFEEAEEFINRK